MPTLLDRVLLAAFLAGSASLMAAMPAHAGLVSITSDANDLSMVEPLAPAIVGSGPTLPPGVNTPQQEFGVSASANARLIAFARSADPFSPRTFHIADRQTSIVVELAPPAKSAGVGDPRLLTLSPDGRSAAFIFNPGRTDNATGARLTEAIIVDLSAFPSGPYPELRRVTVDAAGAGDTTARVTDANLANDGRVTWSLFASTNNGAAVPFAVVGNPGQAAEVVSPQIGLLRSPSDLVLAPTAAGPTIAAAIQQNNSFAPPTRLVTLTTTGTPTMAQLQLPGVTISSQASESAPSTAESGRYLSWLSRPISGARKLFVYDTATQALVNPVGRALTGFPSDQVLAMADTPAITTFTAPARITTIAKPRFQVRLSTRNSVGILVQRVAGTTEVLGKKVPKLTTVGRVPFGSRAKGKQAIRWDGRVAGKRLTAGTYLITLRALRGTKVIELSTPRTVTVR